MKRWQKILWYLAVAYLILLLIPLEAMRLGCIETTPTLGERNSRCRF